MHGKLIMDCCREYFFHRPSYRGYLQGAVDKQVEREEPVELPFVEANLVGGGFHGAEY